MVKSAADKARNAGADSPVVAAIEHSSREAADYQPAKEKPNKSRKRAADYFGGDGGGDAESSSKTTKPKKNSEVEKLDEHESGKEDGHPIDTTKTIPGGDMAELEPEPAAKRQRGRPREDKTMEPTKSKSKAKGIMSAEVAAMKKQFQKDDPAVTATNKTTKPKAVTKESTTDAKTGGKVGKTGSKASKDQKVMDKDPDVSESGPNMDREPFETLLETEKVKSSGVDSLKAKGAKSTTKAAASKDKVGEASGKVGKSLAPSGSDLKGHAEARVSTSSSKVTKSGKIADVEQKKQGSTASKKSVMKSKQDIELPKEGNHAEGTPPMDPVAIGK